MLPWMLLSAPVLAFFFAIDIVIPFLWICSAIGWGLRSVTGYHGDLYGGILGGHRPFELPVMLCLVLGLHVTPPAAPSRTVSPRHLVDPCLRDLLDAVPAPDPPLRLPAHGEAG